MNTAIYMSCIVSHTEALVFMNIGNLLSVGAWGSVVVEALRYKSVGPGIDSKL